MICIARYAEPIRTGPTIIIIDERADARNRIALARTAPRRQAQPAHAAEMQSTGLATEGWGKRYAFVFSR